MTDSINVKLSIDEVNLVLEGLGSMPFARVHHLIGAIQQQATAQLKSYNLPPGDPQTDGDDSDER